MGAMNIVILNFIFKSVWTFDKKIGNSEFYLQLKPDIIIISAKTHPFVLLQ